MGSLLHSNTYLEKHLPKTLLKAFYSLEYPDYKEYGIKNHKYFSTLSLKEDQNGLIVNISFSTANHFKRT